MTEHYPIQANAVNGLSLPGPQGLTCFYDDDLGKDFVDKDIAATFDTLPRTGVYSLEPRRVRAFARKTLFKFDPLITGKGAFDSACARVEQFAGRTATAFNRGAALSDRARNSASAMDASQPP